MVAVEKVKVDSVGDLLHRDRLHVRLVLEDELLQEEKGTLVVDLLANLDDGAPRVVRSNHVAIHALEVVDDELNDKHLLQDDAGEYLLLYGELDLQRVMGMSNDQAALRPRV